MQWELFDLNLLKALHLLLQERNVTVAARKYHVTQPTMSGLLRRLREHFNDPLLVPHGRAMKLSVRGEQLVQPVADALDTIRAQIFVARQILPAEAHRHFVIEANDAITHVILSDLLARLAQEAPGLTFDIIRPKLAGKLRVERGELDLALVPRPIALPNHPTETLFRESFVLVGCASNPALRLKPSLDAFLAMPQIGVRMEGESFPVAESWMRTHFGERRRVAAYVGGYIDLPGFLLGTDRIAVVHRRLAERFAVSFPLVTRPLPVAFPTVDYLAQWSKTSERDRLLRWLVNEIVADARAGETSLLPSADLPLARPLPTPPAVARLS